MCVCVCVCVCVYEGITGTSTTADGTGRGRGTNCRAGVWQSGATDDAKCHPVWYSEAHHSIGSSNASRPTAADTDRTVTKRANVDTADTAQDHDQFNDADTDVCRGNAAATVAGQH